MKLIKMGELLAVASDYGIHLTVHAIHHALRTGSLQAAEHNPPRFTEDACNAFLSELVREERRL